MYRSSLFIGTLGRASVFRPDAHLHSFLFLFQRSILSSLVLYLLKILPHQDLPIEPW